MPADHMLSDDTQAILLLCGRFGEADAAEPLSLGEYNKLAEFLRDARMRPRDLLGGVEDQSGRLIADFDPERLHRLLDRGVQMGFAVEEWDRQGIWVLGRGDEAYPRRLKTRLGRNAPALLFGVGERDLLESGGLGIVGSRHADDAALQFVQDVAERCAAEGVAVVSGGAKGVDRQAMAAALGEGGRVLGVLPEGVARAALSKANRRPVNDGLLTLVSPYHPDARWTVGNAMGRNKHIYSLADWTLVASSDTDGGTWAGATECLKRGWGSLFIRDAEDAPEGNAKLIAKGGVPLTQDALAEAESLQALFSGLAVKQEAPGEELTLFPALDAATSAQDSAPRSVEESAAAYGAAQAGEVPDDIFSLVWPTLATLFVEERSEKELGELATHLNVLPGQLKAWVQQAVDEGSLEKKARPVRYVLAAAGDAAE